jgi:hypothetical protein
VPSSSLDLVVDEIPEPSKEEYAEWVRERGFTREWAAEIARTPLYQRLAFRSLVRLRRHTTSRTVAPRRPRRARSRKRRAHPTTRSSRASRDPDDDDEGGADPPDGRPRSAGLGAVSAHMASLFDTFKSKLGAHVREVVLDRRELTGVAA